MTRWEYTYAHMDPSDDPVREINQFGKEGWEVCAYQPENKDHHGVFFLKRPVPVAPLNFGPTLPKCAKCGTVYAGRECHKCRGYAVEGLCPRDGSPCESAGSGIRCCGEGEAF